MNNLKDIHNQPTCCGSSFLVVLSGFQWTIWRIYTTASGWLGLFSLLFYQDFNEQFEGYTQLYNYHTPLQRSCFIRISMNNLKDIHNLVIYVLLLHYVVLSGFQWTIWRIYTTDDKTTLVEQMLFYQDFNEQFEGYTQHNARSFRLFCRCFIRISMNNLKDIHNWRRCWTVLVFVVLSGFQWTIWRIYTTTLANTTKKALLFYQDFNEQFEGYTQLWSMLHWSLPCCFIRISMNNLKDIHNYCAAYCCVIMLFYQDFNEQFEGYTQRSMIGARIKQVVLSGFQWTIWRIYTTIKRVRWMRKQLFYQDFNEQFEGYTQQHHSLACHNIRCFIRISMNNLKDIHNNIIVWLVITYVVLSGFQWTIWRIYTTIKVNPICNGMLFYQDFNEQFEGYTQRVRACII